MALYTFDEYYNIYSVMRSNQIVFKPNLFAQMHLSNDGTELITN